MSMALLAVVLATCTIPARDVAVCNGRGRTRPDEADRGFGRDQGRRTQPDASDVGVKS